jgi:BioD-like phosphotransacetylase family protein
LAGGDKDAGKTTLSLGLVAHFKKRLPGGAAFIKPLGQKTTLLDGTYVGQDSYLLDRALDLGISLDHSAPFAASSGAAKNYITSGEPADILKRVKKAYRKLESQYDMVVVEGTGHPGVGSVFDLSNGRVANQLGTPVILILDGGIGSTIDRFTLCASLFRQERVRIAGVVLNRILPEKMDQVKEILTPWFDKQRIPILGFIPYHRPLVNPSLGVLQRDLKAEAVFVGDGGLNSLVSGYVSAFGSTEEVLQQLSSNPGSALVVSATRSDVIDAIIARQFSGEFSGAPKAVILCGKPAANGVGIRYVADACKKMELPLFWTEKPACKTSSRLQSKIFKVEPDESVKIDEIVSLVEKHVDTDRIMEILNPSPSAKPVKQKRGGLFQLLRGPGRMLSNIFRRQKKKQ